MSSLLYGQNSRMQDAPVAVNIVVERQLLVHLDIALREDAHAHLAADGPLGDDAVRLARVVEEASLAAFLRGVDKLPAHRSSAHMTKMKQG